MKKVFIHLTSMLFIFCFTTLVKAQMGTSVHFRQSVDVQPYQKKKFRFTGAVKIITSDKNSKAQLWVRVDKKDKTTSFFDNMNNRPVLSKEWKKYSIEGTIDKDADKLFFGGICNYGGPFFFDDFKLEIEIKQGHWKEIPIVNSGFEQWSKEGKPIGWAGTIDQLKNYESNSSKEHSYRGQYALLITTNEYNVRFEHPVKEIRSHAKFEHISPEQGLPHSEVYCLLQDSQGFIWTGTKDGLARYDGYNFKVFRNDELDSLSISDNTITVIYEDQRNQLWIGTQSGGLNLFDRKNEHFYRFQHHPEDSLSLSQNFITAIYEDQENNLWVGTIIGGLNCLNQKTGQFTSYRAKGNDLFSLYTDRVSAICEDLNGILWVATYWGGLAYFDPETNKFHNYVLINEYKNYGSRYILSIYTDKKGMLWLATENGLYRFDPVKKEFVDLFLFSDPKIPNQFASLSKDSSGYLWFLGGGGVCSFDVSNQQIKIYKHKSEESNSIKSRVQCTLIDREGMLWLGTSEGIFRLNIIHEQFQQLPGKLSFSNNFDDEEIGPILEDSKDRLWVGTGNGLNQLNLKTGKNTLFQKNQEDSTSLQEHSFIYLYEDPKGEIWLSSENYGLTRFDQQKRNFQNFGTKSKNSLRYIHSIIEHKDNNLWLGTWGGLSQFERSSEKLFSIPWKSADGKGRSFTNISVLFKDRSEIIWVGTFYGELKYYNYDTQLFHDFTPTPEGTNIQRGKNSISCIHEDQEGIFWIGTSGNGFRRLDRKTRSYAHFTEKDGLINNGISGILEDEQGKLWISTQGGLSCFNPQTKQFRNYDINDGLPSNELGMGYKSKKTGTFYFGSKKGLVAFHPENIHENTQEPSIVITALNRYNIEESEGEAIPVIGISNKSSISFSYKNDLLGFEFAVLSFTKSAKNEYAYKMEGLSDQWIQLGTKREITFTNLSHGTYTLHVKGSNGDGVWNKEGLSLDIIITPPWWLTWWAYILYGLGILSILYFIYRFQLHRHLEHAENIRLKELDTVKTQLYTNITHEFRTPLTVIMGMAEEIAGNETQKKLIRRNSENLLNLVNQMLDLHKLESGTLKLKMVQGEVIGYLKYIMESFHSLAESKEIRMHFLSDPTEFMMDYDSEKLLHIISNLLSNSIKFTPQGGDVYVSVSVEHSLVNHQFEQIQIKVKDTGIGISAEKLPLIFDRFYQVEESNTRKGEGTGIGLALTKALVELLEGNISVKSEPGKGTEFELALPVKIQAMHEPAKDKKNIPMIAIETTDYQLINQPLKQHLPLALIIEDNPDVVQYLIACLEKEYQLEIGRDGKEGIEKAIKTTPDLIISDVMMPYKDGFEVTQTLKNDERTSHIPIILLTAKADVASKIEGLERGADAYMAKPFNKVELLVRLKNLMELRQKLRYYYLSIAGATPMDEAPLEAAAEQVVENNFVQKIRSVVEDHLDDNSLDVEKVCQELGMSHSQVHRKLNALTGYSTNKFIRYIRLTKAKVLLTKTGETIAAVAYDTGFNDPDYFSRMFKKEFGVTATDFREQI
jgi:ligand-binding sensor domain-containing protein/signal transduction histidine kinase/DNA-binding response OmpR family regulator